MSSSLAHNSPAKDGTHFHMGKLRLVGMTHACTHARTHTHTHTRAQSYFLYTSGKRVEKQMLAILTLD